METLPGMLEEGRRRKLSWALQGSEGGLEDIRLVPGSYQPSWRRQIPRGVSRPVSLKETCWFPVARG